MDDDSVGEAAAAQPPVAEAEEKMSETQLPESPLPSPPPPPPPVISSSSTSTRTPRQSAKAAAAAAAGAGSPSSPPSAAAGTAAAGGGGTKRKARKPSKKDAAAAAAAAEDDGDMLLDGDSAENGGGGASAAADETAVIRAVAVYGHVPGKGGLVAGSVPVLCGTLLELHLHQRTLLDGLFDTVDQMFFAPLPPGGVDEMYFDWLLAQAPPHLAVNKKGGGPLRYADFATNRARGEASSLRRTMCIALKKVKPFDAIEIMAHSELEAVSALRSGLTPQYADPTPIIQSLFEVEPPLSLPPPDAPPPSSSAKLSPSAKTSPTVKEERMADDADEDEDEAAASDSDPAVGGGAAVDYHQPDQSPVKQEDEEKGQTFKEEEAAPAAAAAAAGAAFAASAAFAAAAAAADAAAAAVAAAASETTEPAPLLLKTEEDSAAGAGELGETLSAPAPAAPPAPPPVPRVTRSQIKRSSPAAPSGDFPSAPPKKTRKGAAMSLLHHHQHQQLLSPEPSPAAAATPATEPVKQTAVAEEPVSPPPPFESSEPPVKALAEQPSETAAPADLEIVEAPPCDAAPDPPRTPQEEVFARWMKREAKAIMRRRVEESADLSPDQKSEKIEQIRQSEFPYVKKELGRFARLDYLCSPAVEFSVATNWTPREIAIFQVALCTYGQDFAEISNCIRTKTYKEAYLFYTLAFKQSSRYASFKFHKKIAAWYALT